MASPSSEHLHDPNFVKKIKDQVLQDIEYIKNFKSSAPNAKPTSGWKNEKAVKMISQNIYPQIYGFLIKNFSKEEAIERLREMGQRSNTILYSIYPQWLKRRGSMLEVLREIGVHSRERVSIIEQTLKNGIIQKCILKKYKCIFCTEGFSVENPSLALCYPSVAFWQHHYNLRSLYLGNMNPKLIYIDVIKTAVNDNDYCLYRVEAIE